MRGREKSDVAISNFPPCRISVEQSMVPRLPVPGKGSKHFCPLHLGARVTKKNTTQSSTGWSKALLTQKRDRTRSASNSGCGPLLAGRSLPVADAGQLAYVHSSVPPWKEGQLQ